MPTALVHSAQVSIHRDQVRATGDDEKTFLSQGWRSLIRPSSSHFTSASSSFVCSTVPNSPVGFPKLAKPSTRSPGFSSESGAEGWTSGGLLARSASAGAPACDRGGCGALRSFGVSLLIRLIFHYPSGLFRLFIRSLTRAYAWKAWLR
jgi:hypothetical protein